MAEDPVPSTAEEEGLVAPPISAAEMTAIAHLHRAEVTRAESWRTRLDATTNWAVALTGVALSVTFSDAESSPLPLLLTAFLVLVFLTMEARRYRYYDIWQTRVRLLEVCFYGPILRREEGGPQQDWLRVLDRDYASVRYHISFLEAVRRRIRRNYGWILMAVLLAYLAKVAIHPVAATRLPEIVERMSIGPVPGEAIAILGGSLFVVITLLAIPFHRPSTSGRILGLEEEEDPIRKFGLDF